MRTTLDIDDSEAIRRSLVAQRNSLRGISRQMRWQRAATLEHLVEIFEGSDPVAEVRRLKRENEGF